MNKNKFSKVLVAFIIIINILFTIACLYVFLKTGSEPVTLIGCWFAFTTGELWLMAKIKRDKVVKQKRLRDNYIQHQIRKKGDAHNE